MFILFGDFLFREVTSNSGKYGEMAVAYLEEKYNESFTLKSSTYNPVFGGHYEIRVTPVGSKFPRVNMVVKKIPQGIEYRDDYQIKKYFQPILEQLFPPERYFFEVSYNSPDMAFSNEFNDITENDKRESISLNIKIAIVEDRERYEKKILNEIDKIFKLLNGEKVKYSANFYITYYDNTQFTKHSFLQNSYEKDYINFATENEDKEIVTCTINHSSKNYGMENIDTYCKKK